jgi:hypothetical protein
MVVDRAALDERIARILVDLLAEFRAEIAATVRDSSPAPVGGDPASISDTARVGARRTVAPSIMPHDRDTTSMRPMWEEMAHALGTYRGDAARRHSLHRRVCIVCGVGEQHSGAAGDGFHDEGTNEVNQMAMTIFRDSPQQERREGGSRGSVHASGGRVDELFLLARGHRADHQGRPGPACLAAFGKRHDGERPPC